MALQIMDSPPKDLADTLKEAIEGAIPDSQAVVKNAGPGHYEIRVVAQAFQDKSKVQMQQMVYAAITPWMSGDSAPVHAIDRMETLLPESGSP